MLATAAFVLASTVMRGAMVAPNPSASDLETLGRDWHANLIRYQLQWEGFPRSKADGADPAAYRAWLQTALAHFDSVLPTCKKAGLRVVLDMHTGPGGRDTWYGCRILQTPEFAEEFVHSWREIARRYRGDRTIWAFDLLNEPSASDHDITTWNSLALRAAKAIREVDPQRTLVFEPAPWAGCSGFVGLEPLPLKNVVYSPHFYDPPQFTHQGVAEHPLGAVYPGVIAGESWDKRRMERTLAPVDAFQRKYNVPIYVGEFSVIRWAPGDSGVRYLADLIELFEQRGWSWTYHAFREWDGWSVEHGPVKGDPDPSASPTDRERLLRKWFARNR